VRLNTNINALTIPLPFLRKEKIAQQYHSIGVAHTVFTPQELERSDIIVNDRPYASFQFISYGIMTLLDDINSIVNLELNVGAMGKNFSRDFQTKIHREGWFGSTRPVPNGWHHQIANGGAFGINLHTGYQRYLYEYYKGKSKWGDNEYDVTKRFIPLYAAAVSELNVGNVLTNAAVGLQLGLLNYNSIFGTHNPMDLIAVDGGQEEKSWRFNTSITLTPRLRYAFHNAYLTGELLATESVTAVPQDKLCHVLFEYDAVAAFGARFKNKVEVRASYGMSGRSKEFSYQNKDFHHWGQVSLGLNYILK
jgi:hypothetical protein